MRLLVHLSLFSMSKMFCPFCSVSMKTDQGRLRLMCCELWVQLWSYLLPPGRAKQGGTVWKQLWQQVTTCMCTASSSSCLRLPAYKTEKTFPGNTVDTGCWDVLGSSEKASLWLRLSPVHNALHLFPICFSLSEDVSGIHWTIFSCTAWMNHMVAPQDNAWI